MNHRSSVELQPLAKRQVPDHRHHYDRDFHVVRPSFRSFILVCAFGSCRGAGFGKSFFLCNRDGTLGVPRCGMDDDVQSLLRKHRYRQAFERLLGLFEVKVFRMAITFVKVLDGWMRIWSTPTG